MIKYIPAERNLGCEALKIGEWFYIDTFKDSWPGRRGFFMNIKHVGRFWFWPWSLSVRYEGWFFLRIHLTNGTFYVRNWIKA